MSIVGVASQPAACLPLRFDHISCFLFFPAFFSPTTIPFFEVAFNSWRVFFLLLLLPSSLCGKGVKKRIFLCNNLDAFLRFVASVAAGFIVVVVVAP